MTTQTTLFNMETEKKEDGPVKVITKPSRKCENPGCGKDFVPKNSRKKYCSASCNAQASKIRAAQAYAPVASSLNGAGFGAVQQMYAIPPHATMMIEHYKKESDRWEKKYNDEVADHKATHVKLQALKDEQKDNENPKGLQGFVQNNPELINKCLEIFGPVLASKMASGPAVGVDGVNNEMVQMLAGWFTKLQPATQQNLYQLMQNLSTINDEEKMNYLVLDIIQNYSS
jgi:hypothetical protein